MLLSHWLCFSWKFNSSRYGFTKFLNWFFRSLHQFLEIYIEYWRKLSNLVAFLKIFLHLKNKILLNIVLIVLIVLYTFFSWNFIYFQQKVSMKVKFGEISYEQFGFLLSRSYKVSAKTVQKRYLSWHWRVMQSLKNNWLAVSNMRWKIWWISIQPLKSLKISFRWSLIVKKYARFGLKKHGGVIFHDTEL